MPTERDVMAHGIGPAGGACDQAQRDMPRVDAYSGRHSTERSGSQRGSGRHGSAQSGGGDYQQAMNAAAAIARERSVHMLR